MSDNDKQMIVKALLDLKGEVDRLKAIVEAGGTPQALPATGMQHPAPHYVDAQDNEPEEQPGDPDTVTIPDGISMRKASDELIERCLAKHGGKVKAAAAELGISERTIYRKLADWKNKGRR